LIYDTKLMAQQMQSLGYDTKKMPLGKLSLSNIEQGFKILKEISETIENGANHNRLLNLSSQFYTQIPHDFGWQKMSSQIIKDPEQVKAKLELLESLRDIQIAHKLKDQKEEGVENPIDANYKKLNCDFEVVDPKSKEYKIIDDYINNTKQYSNVELVHAFRINRHGEKERYTSDIGNKMLLWHGSRLTNFVGILSQGLRIAPPEAPSTGYRFGKGIYLADMFQKSHGYCFSGGSKGTFSILLCEAALGNMNELLHDDFNASKLPPGKHSTKALGHIAPPESSYVKLNDEEDVLVPNGKFEPTKYQHSSCGHNEYIVYDVKQVRLRYVLWMKDKRYI